VERAEVRAWAKGLAALHKRIGRHFVRPEVRRRSRRYLAGLLGPVERKNGWQLAEQSREATPDGMQRLLNTARWDADAVRDDLRGYVWEHLAGDDGVLVVDETGFLKKGDKSVGVQRQYSGTAGRIANCQIGVFLAYASAKGRAFIDRELYLPRSWADDAARRRAAGVPDDVAYRSTTGLGRAMLGRALEAGVAVGWVTADALYGSDGELRRWLEGRRQAYVLGVRSNAYVVDREAWRQITVGGLIGRLPAQAWRRLSAGDGAKGPRLYDWACVRDDRLLPEGWAAWVLARRGIADPTEIAYYLAFGPADATVEDLVRVAGMRWTIEEALEVAKNEVGLDQYEVRRWDGWYRHITLALLAHAFLAVTRVEAAKGAA
jgi:SRSO17 transposase